MLCVLSACSCLSCHSTLKWCVQKLSHSDSPVIFAPRLFSVSSYPVVNFVITELQKRSDPKTIHGSEQRQCSITSAFFPPAADNVLLSADGKDTFLCDFGHAERLDNHGQSLSVSRGKYCATADIQLRGLHIL